MTYEQQIKMIVTYLYNETKCFATSSTYHIPYEKIKNAYGMWVGTHNIQLDIREEFSQNHLDRIQALDFDDIKQEVVVMIWESNNKKRYTINQYKEFCNDALVLPPLDDFYDGNIDEEKWYETHKIHIMVGNHDMELDYYADNVTEIYSALEEMYEIENEIQGIKDSKKEDGDEYPNATWKDILKVAVLMIFERNDFNYKGAIKTVHKFFDDEHLREALMFAAKGYDELNHHFKVNFLKVETNELYKLFDENVRYETLKNILCSDLQIEELYDKDGRCADKVMLTDYSIRPTGDFVGWHYGVEWDKNHEDNQWYIRRYIEEMTK